MMNTQKTSTELRYRKRPEPRRVVPLASLKRTKTESTETNLTPIVNYSGNIDEKQTWKPLMAESAPIEISPNSWSGLHSRVLASLPLKVEAS